jgi:glutathione S-transferase
MPSSNPLLYTYRRCPYAMRARMALLLAGVAFDAHEIVLRDKPADMLAVSPKGTVPVLVLCGNRVLEQSWSIVEWALNQESAGPEVRGWWSRAQSPNHQNLLLCNDGDFKHHLDRYKYPDRYAHEMEGGVFNSGIEHRDRAVALLLAPLEASLGQGKYLGGDQPCATDIGIFPFVRQFAAVDPVWFAALPLSRIHQWLDTWRRSPLFEASMHKLPTNKRVSFPGAGDFAKAFTPGSGWS